MKDNVPKASYNMARIFNGLSGNWVSLSGTDGDVSGVAAWDAERGRVAIVIVNFRDRYAVRRQVSVEIGDVPGALEGGKWIEWTVDATHSNVWHDPGRAELSQTGTGALAGSRFGVQRTLMPNSVTLLELLRK